MTTTINPMLTLVAVPCVLCGSTAETVRRDRELLDLGDSAVCCSPSSKIRVRSVRPPVTRFLRSDECA
jgi:hypothetical protein